MTIKVVKQTSMSTRDKEYSLYEYSLESLLSKNYSIQQQQNMGKETLISSMQFP